MTTFYSLYLRKRLQNDANEWKKEFVLHVVSFFFCCMKRSGFIENSKEDNNFMLCAEQINALRTGYADGDAIATAFPNAEKKYNAANEYKRKKFVYIFEW